MDKVIQDINKVIDVASLGAKVVGATALTFIIIKEFRGGKS